MRQIADVERRFMSIPFPASGSLYHRRDLDSSHHVIPVLDDIVVGSTAQYEWWYQERASLEVDRGPSRSLDVPSDHRMSRPTLRHPDFSPNNILVNTSNDVVGIIDWQHAVVLPFCLCAGIPDHFQKWGDPLSETLSKPEVKLPENFDRLSHEEQENIQETIRRRIVHSYYAALTT
ncbi:hypothetical protein POX_e07049 [Penicillium oxalicum]|uniref:hypothetical protein n=1 Tax=Penicillium oxalicum TaxID=69781 RepID=UPI0020B80DCF|nr:hypothetical protein POX_e07049 [Penicillium oxalicum]KAI2789023.1 hypothetical protein POX_e07049 [Penicillium oxalicum]